MSTPKFSLNLIFIRGFAKLRLKYGSTFIQRNVLEGFDDGVIVINRNNRIIYLNTTAANVIGIPAHNAVGISIESIMVNWNNLFLNTKAKAFEYKGSVNFSGTWRYFSVRFSTLQNKRGKDIARIIVLRDTTDRKNDIALRQKTRDEMFVFLRSIFNSISTSSNQDVFLQNALYQIAYTFNIQHGAFVLNDIAPLKKANYTLSARLGSLLQKKDMISKFHKMMDIDILLSENNSPIVTDSIQDPSLLEYADGSEYLSIAVFPLLYNSQRFGILMLARTIPMGFNPDEVSRLTIVADELASFLNTERNKRNEIALAERQRLIRDLHDSITQKLYGMVVLTELVQIGTEAGSIQDSREQIAQISENARQALREMRLFLYELEPVDLESEGLVSVLQNRIASVESRSGLRARILCDDDISLSKEKEMALYYIVQEALNNILKHAQAKSVFIKLKNRKDSIHLQVIDDGMGFDLKNIERGGIGIKNMRARAAEIGAKLKIITSKDKGTKISVSVSR